MRSPSAVGAPETDDATPRGHLQLDLVASSPEWLATVLGNFDTFLKDHASCEKKASGMALNVASHYPDQPRLLETMVDLAVEELTHYREVVRLMASRSVAPGPDNRDEYVRGLNRLVRQGTERYLLDRLLVAAVIERRGAERFALIADAVEDDSLAKFYHAIAASEARHWQLFVDLALDHASQETVDARLGEIVAAEASLLTSLPFRAALH